MPKIYTEDLEHTKATPLEAQKTTGLDVSQGLEQIQPLTFQKMGRREHFKQKLTKLWVGRDVGGSMVAENMERTNDKRHHLRFWKNKKEESARNAEHTASLRSAYESSPNASSFTIRGSFSSIANSRNSASPLSESDTDIHRHCTPESGAEKPSGPCTSESRIETVFERSVPKAALSSSPPLEARGSWNQFNPITTTSSSSAVDTFSPVNGSFSPVTPFTGTDSVKERKSYSATQISCNAFPPKANKKMFVREQPRPPIESQIPKESLHNMKWSPTKREHHINVRKSEMDITDGVDPRSAKPYSKTWENIGEELWLAKVLREYCPVRLRKNKRLNFDSDEFRSMQAELTLKTLIDQELQDKDKRLIFRPSLLSGKSFFRGIFHFEEDVDVLETMEHFILCNEGLIPLFSGSRPAVRKHFFRRWHNYDRDRIIVCEQLMEKWLEDDTYLTKLTEDRKRRQQRRLELEQSQESDDKLPPLSFFVKKLLLKINGTRGRIGKPPKRGSKLLVYKKEPLFGVPYFEKKKLQVKGWIKDLVLSI